MYSALRTYVLTWLPALTTRETVAGFKLAKNRFYFISTVYFPLLEAFVRTGNDMGKNTLFMSREVSYH